MRPRTREPARRLSSTCTTLYRALAGQPQPRGLRRAARRHDGARVYDHCGQDLHRFYGRYADHHWAADTSMSTDGTPWCFRSSRATPIATLAKHPAEPVAGLMRFSGPLLFERRLSFISHVGRIVDLVCRVQSGRVARSCVPTWMAPTTSPVTFDTRGEVRFTAQWGQTDIVAAFRAGLHFCPVTPGALDACV